MYKHSIYVPSQSSQRVISPAFRQSVLQYVQQGMVQAFGGCTSVEGVGHWTDDSGNIQTEHVIIVYSYGEHIDYANVLALALLVKSALAQDTVLYTVEQVDSVTFV